MALRPTNLGGLKVALEIGSMSFSGLDCKFLGFSFVWPSIPRPGIVVG